VPVVVCVLEYMSECLLVFLERAVAGYGETVAPRREYVRRNLAPYGHIEPEYAAIHSNPHPADELLISTLISSRMVEEWGGCLLLHLILLVLILLLSLKRCLR